MSLDVHAIISAILRNSRCDGRGCASMYGAPLHESWTHDDWVRVSRNAAEDRALGSLPLGLPREERDAIIRRAKIAAECAYRVEVARLGHPVPR